LRESQRKADSIGTGTISRTSPSTIKPKEVEEVLSNHPVFIEAESDERSGEELSELGHTNAGRILFVIWTPRGKRSRPVTAYDADPKTQALYTEAQFRRDDE
jgi:uncharacterized DUF497 family protein